MVEKVHHSYLKVVIIELFWCINAILRSMLRGIMEFWKDEIQTRPSGSSNSYLLTSFDIRPDIRELFSSRYFSGLMILSPPENLRRSKVFRCLRRVDPAFHKMEILHESRIQNPFKHLRWNDFCNKSSNFDNFVWNISKNVKSRHHYKNCPIKLFCAGKNIFVKAIS